MSGLFFTIFPEVDHLTRHFPKCFLLRQILLPKKFGILAGNSKAAKKIVAIQDPGDRSVIYDST